MALVLHFHPLSSFCQKVVVALYEKGTAFTPHLVDLMAEAPAPRSMRSGPLASSRSCATRSGT